MESKATPRRRLVANIMIPVACIFTVLVVVLHLPLTHWSFASTPSAISASKEMQLRRLGHAALVSRDVPVAALIVFGDSIIGEGYNTVLKDTNACGHAEINAISDAVREVGWNAFKYLNRDSLLLITTLEPCAMCSGALLEYRITRVQYVKPKPFLFLLKDELRGLRSRWLWSKAGNESLQDSLFFSHPDYLP